MCKIPLLFFFYKLLLRQNLLPKAIGFAELLHLALFEVCKVLVQLLALACHLVANRFNLLAKFRVATRKRAHCNRQSSVLLILAASLRLALTEEPILTLGSHVFFKLSSCFPESLGECFREFLQRKVQFLARFELEQAAFGVLVDFGQLVPQVRVELDFAALRHFYTI